MTGRRRLPHRRPSLTRLVAHRDHRFSVTIGFDASGTPREVFAGGVKEGSDLQAVISDACILVSIILQHGVTTAALARSLGRVPDPAGTPGREVPASALGAIVASIEEVLP